MSRAVSPNTFLFIAATSAGRKRIGLRQALDQRRLADLLRRERLLLLRSWRLPAWLSRQRKLRLKDQAELNTQLAQLLHRGVPLVEALEVTSSTVSSVARPTIERIREQVAAGASFSDAAESTRCFDAVSIAVYRAAERTGDLAEPARGLATTARRQLAVSGKAATLLMYPAIVLSLSFAVTLLMLVAIVPRIGHAIEDSGGSLPLFTRAMVVTGVWLGANWLWVLIGVLALALAAAAARARIAPVIAAAMRRAPLLGRVVLAQESARFFSVMGAMSKAAVPLADALGTANQALSHPRLRRQLETLRQRLVEGGILRQLIEGVTEFPLATRRLLIAAERAGDLDSAFDALAADLTDEVDRRSARLLAVLEPLLIVVMFLIIGTLLLSIMIPLMHISSQAMG